MYMYIQNPLKYIHPSQGWLLQIQSFTLQASPPGHSGRGQEKEGVLTTTSLEFEFHLQFPCGSPSIEL